MEKCPDSLQELFTQQNIADLKEIGYEIFTLDLRRRDQTGTYLFRIHPSACKRENETGTKMFCIRRESVNVV